MGVITGAECGGAAGAAAPGQGHGGGGGGAGEEDGDCGIGGGPGATSACRLCELCVKGKGTGRRAGEEKPGSQGAAPPGSEDKGSGGQTAPKFPRAFFPWPARRYGPENLKSPVP